MSYFCEFSVKIACDYGLEIAIIHGYFKRIEYLSTLQEMPSIPTIEECLAHLKFWNEEKIRFLIGQLYVLKLI